MSKSTTLCKRCGQPRPNHAPTCLHSHRVPSLEQRFWLRVHKTDSCWLWDGGRLNEYGRLMENKRKIYVHRYSYELHYGPIPDGLWVLHTCDTPACVRPDHLFLGTVADNAADMAAKHRTVFQQHPEKAPKGERHGMAKLTDEDVRVIRQQRAIGIRTSVLARNFDVDITTIRLIVNRKIWRHIE